jgi:hypothetical protein
MNPGKIITVLSLVFGSATCMGQASTSGPKLDPLVDGTSVVTGMATVGSAPIVVYDASTATKTMMGTATTTAPNGRFYCALKPSLVAGHKVIAIDKNGNAGPVATVAAKSPNTGRVP